MKNKHTNIFIITLIIPLFASCSFYAKKVLGIKKFKERDDVYIQKVIQKYEIDHAVSYRLSPLNLEYDSTTGIDFMKYSAAMGLGAGTVVFDKNGTYIDLYGESLDEKVCLGQTEDLIRGLKITNPILIDSVKIESFLPLISLSDQKKLHRRDLPEAEFYFVIPWAGWYKQTIRDGLRDQYAFIKKLDEEKYFNAHIIVVNTDWHESWQLPDEFNPRKDAKISFFRADS